MKNAAPTPITLRQLGVVIVIGNLLNLALSFFWLTRYVVLIG
jgi:hypothetical protein